MSTKTVSKYTLNLNSLTGGLAYLMPLKEKMCLPNLEVMTVPFICPRGVVINGSSALWLLFPSGNAKAHPTMATKTKCRIILKLNCINLLSFGTIGSKVVSNIKFSSTCRRVVNLLVC